MISWFVQYNMMALLVTGLTERKKPEKQEKQLVFEKKEIATLAQRIEILNWFHKNGENQSRTAAHFNPIYSNLKTKQPLVSNWMKNEEKWRKQWAEAQGDGWQKNPKRVKQTEHPEVTEMLELWVAKAMQGGVNLTGEIIQQKWTHFANIVGVPDDDRLQLSKGWLTSFKRRCSLKEFKAHGEAGSADPSKVASERVRVQNLIEESGYGLKDLFNMDETGLFYA